MWIIALFWSCFVVGQGKKDSIVYIHGDQLKLLETITGRISPKSVVSNGKGVFFAQNMMYKHTITVYNRSYKLLKTIPDAVRLSDYGFSQYQGTYRGAPVECAFSHGGKYAWVSNYEMSGGTSKEFAHPGCDACLSKTKYDSSFVYKINTSTFEIEEVVQVGAVPKYVAVTPDDSRVLVSNWSSGDLSVIDTKMNKEIKRIDMGRFPRGIVVDNKGTFAYVAIMGDTKIAKLNLLDYSVQWLKHIGRNPRHLCLSPDNQFLYVSLNGEGKIAKIKLSDLSMTKTSTGRLPRSMEISADGRFLYVVNYGSNELAKVETENMTVVTKAKTKSKPIGVTVDDATNNVWTACYSGKIMVFHDTYYDSVAVNYYEKEEELLALARRKETERKRKNGTFKNTTFSKEYTLVSGSFSKASSARRRVRELKKKGISGKVFHNPKNGRYYAVIGEYDNREEAKKMGREYDIDFWVFRVPSSKESKPKNTVQPKPIEKQVQAKESVASTSLKPYLIVSGSFDNKANARNRVKELSKQGFKAQVYYNPNNGRYYAVPNSFDTRGKAKQFLKQTNIDGWVYKK